MCAGNLGRLEGTIQTEGREGERIVFQSRIFHDTTKHLLKISVISFQNVSVTLSSSLTSLGSAESLDGGWKGPKYVRVGLNYLFRRLVAQRWREHLEFILRKCFPSVGLCSPMKKGKGSEQKFLKKEMKITY